MGIEVLDVEVVDAPARARWWARRLSVSEPVVVAGLVAMGVAVVGLLVRWWELDGRIPGWWNDTGAYDAVSQRSWFDGRFWAAERPAGVPLVLKLVGDPPSYRFQAVNVGVACLAWGWLAGELVRSLRVVGLRAVAVGAAVLGLSFTSDLILWDSQVLSESLAISLCVAVVAAVLRALRVRSAASVAALLAVAWLWTLMRDTNAVTLIVLAAAAAVWLLRFRPRDVPRRLGLVGAVGLLAVALSSMASAWVGHRDIVPLADVFAVRINGYPDRVEWFRDHGMPQADDILAAGTGLVGEPRVLELGKEDPAWAEWWRWLRSDGKAAWVRFIVENPTYLFEPLKSPERTYNNADGTVRGYAGEMRVVPFVDDILWAPTPLVVFGVGAFSLALLATRRRPSTVVVLAWTLVAAAAVSGYATWHTGGMETARHLLLSAFEVRLALVLLALGVLVRPAEAEEPIGV